MQNLIITGGINHAFDASAAALARVLNDAGISSQITMDVDGGLRDVAAGRFPLVTLYALRWRMLDHEKYAPFRVRWAYVLSAAGQQALQGHVAGGGGLLGLHTAALCFDNWPAWRDLLGATWRWGTSFHPDVAPVRVRPVVQAHPIIAGLPSFTVEDETYHGLDVAADARMLLYGGGQPLAWARQSGGRVVYDALGHDQRAIEQHDHARFLRRAALWVAGRPDQELAAY